MYEAILVSHQSDPEPQWHTSCFGQTSAVHRHFIQALNPARMGGGHLQSQSMESEHAKYIYYRALYVANTTPQRIWRLKEDATCLHAQMATGTLFPCPVETWRSGEEGGEAIYEPGNDESSSKTLFAPKLRDRAKESGEIQVPTRSLDKRLELLFLPRHQHPALLSCHSIPLSSGQLYNTPGFFRYGILDANWPGIENAGFHWQRPGASQTHGHPD
jgi:hypothetical protein